MFGSIKKLLALRKLQGLWKKRNLTSRKWWEEFVGTALKVPEINDFVRGTMQNLQGYKTYILAAVIGAATVAKALGYLDENTYNTLMGLLGAGTAATLAAKMNRTEMIAKEVQTDGLITKTVAVQTNNVIQPLVSPSQQGMGRTTGMTGGSSTHPADKSYDRNRK